MLVFFVAALIALASGKEVFYALSDNGIDIINPQTLTVMKRLPHDTVITGTDEVLCTFSPRYKSKCSWGGAATIKGKYVFVADTYGNRVIVIDIVKQEPIKSIGTDGFPYQISYIAALDEVWIHCWKDSYLNVVGSSTGETKIHKIRKASTLMISHSIKAQTADSYDRIMHGYLQAENCQNVEPHLQYGVVSHFSEPGIHKIDLKNKEYTSFINVSSYDCKSTFGLAYSSVAKYAFVQCLGFLRGFRTNKMLVIDVKTEKVVKLDRSVTDGATGTPYASPDGKFVLILNKEKIISYHVKDRQTQIRRLNDIPAYMPSRVAFVMKGRNKTIAYVTLKNSTKLLVVEYSADGQQTVGSISGVGKAADLREVILEPYKKRYRKHFDTLLRMRNEPFSEAKFTKYAREMYLAHITRPIASGCGLLDHFVATPAASEDKVAIVNGKLKTLHGLVKDVRKAKHVVWVK